MNSWYNTSQSTSTINYVNQPFSLQVKTFHYYYLCQPMLKKKYKKHLAGISFYLHFHKYCKTNMHT